MRDIAALNSGADSRHAIPARGDKHAHFFFAHLLKGDPDHLAFVRRRHRRTILINDTSTNDASGPLLAHLRQDVCVK